MAFNLGALGGGLGFVGSVLNIAGQDAAYASQLAAANSERAAINERISDRQRQLRQEVNVFSRKRNQAYGDTVSSFAKAGVDLSGSPLIVLADQKNEMDKTLNNINRAGETDLRLLSLGKDAVNNKADAIQDSKSMAWASGLFSVGGSFLSAGAG